MCAFQSGVNDWVESTPEGREIWEQSSGDLNIGDLDGYEEEESLKRKLAEKGIFKWKDNYTLGNSNEVAYDRILAQPDESKWDEE